MFFTHKGGQDMNYGKVVAEVNISASRVFQVLTLSKVMEKPLNGAEIVRRARELNFCLDKGCGEIFLRCPKEVARGSISQRSIIIFPNWKLVPNPDFIFCALWERGEAFERLISLSDHVWGRYTYTLRLKDA